MKDPFLDPWPRERSAFSLLPWRYFVLGIVLGMVFSHFVLPACRKHVRHFQEISHD